MVLLVYDLANDLYLKKSPLLTIIGQRKEICLQWYFKGIKTM